MNLLRILRHHLPHLGILLWAVCTNPHAVELYDDSLGNTPGDQGWLFAGGLGGSITQTAVPGSGVQLITDNAASAGYSSHIPLFNVPNNAAFPVLDRHQGFTLWFELLVNSETHASSDRSGFSVILLDQDNLGIELSFWEDEIWAKNGDAAFSHAEGVAFDTGAQEVLYQLDIDSSGYRLSAPGMGSLSGLLRDYSTFGAPYSLPNYLFLGDDTSSAGADIILGDVVLELNAVPAPAVWSLLGLGLAVLSLMGSRWRRAPL